MSPFSRDVQGTVGSAPPWACPPTFSTSAGAKGQCGFILLYPRKNRSLSSPGLAHVPPQPGSG